MGSVTEFSLLFISSNCCSMISPASLSVSLLAQALLGKPETAGHRVEALCWVGERLSKLETVGQREEAQCRVCVCVCVGGEAE